MTEWNSSTQENNEGTDPVYPEMEGDVYKRQALEWPALIFAYLRPDQTILGLILEDDDDF